MNLFEENENIVVFKADKDGLDLEEFLSSNDISGRLFRKLYKGKQIYVNGKFKRKGLILERGDLVSIYMENEDENTTPEKMEIDIIYEDFDLLILNKQPNIVVHPTKSHQENTLSNGISYYFKEKGIKKKIRFVNRLDMNTTGILIVAKNPFAHQQMALQFESNEVEKKYQAIVSGIVEKNEDYIDLPIGREEDKSVKKVVTENGQKALTKYTVIEKYKEASLLDVQIFTGRSHQIRVHLNHIGHPIIGDVLYNEESPYIDRQALHSYYLKIKHPRTKKDIEFIASLPEDMKRLINHLKNK
ncbi:RluA family pseudouridine synthase [Tissierella carlieri]|uniref:Pseudouridine synthase n=1 Tax=Tissierella carlieri TaxID=689904 RepID=A0ABT1SD20_9FIRM|nr:RluA family pseudouridine synthase [Tissierella carlieri]MCQ4924210.1 RluA family pseudouridine synthase [Tissierella carlieri]